MSRSHHSGNGKASRGSIIDQCNALVQSSGRISDVIHQGIKAIPPDTVHLVLLQASQVLETLKKCANFYPGSFHSDTQTLRLQECLEILHKIVLSLETDLKFSAKRRKAQEKKMPTKIWHLLKSNKIPSCAPNCSEERRPVLVRFEQAQENFRLALDAIEFSRDSRYQPLYRWLPRFSSQDDLKYWPPIAYETVTGYLLGESRPRRMVIYGPSGSGKTTLTRQLQHAVNDQEADLHSQLSGRFSRGLKWIDCGLTLSHKRSEFAEDLKRLALTLAIKLMPKREENLRSMAVTDLVSAIRENIQDSPVLIVFDNVWDAEMFRPGRLDIFSRQRFDVLCNVAGKQQKGVVLITSQFNIAAELNWHSPETIVVPLTPNSNRKACLQLLQNLWMTKAQTDKFPSNLEPLAKSFVTECGSSPLALQIIARMLNGTYRERKWQDLLNRLNTLSTFPIFRRRSISTLDEEELPKLLFVYQLSASRLPKSMQDVIPALALFPSAKWVPVPALLFTYMHSTGRDLSESCTIIKAMCQASFLDLEVPDGHFLTGKFSYHAVLQNFVMLSPEYNVVQLPSQFSESTSLPLSMAKLYALPSYQEQAAQVFLRCPVSNDGVKWSHKDDPSFWSEKPWLLILELSQNATLGKFGSLIITSACRELVVESEIGPALSQLFGNSVSLYPAAALYSDFVKNIEEDDILADIADHLEKNQAVPRIIMRLRELLSYAYQSPEASPYAEEVKMYAWALADLVQFSSINVVSKLHSEPMIASLEKYEDGVTLPAYQRLTDFLGYSERTY